MYALIVVERSISLRDVSSVRLVGFQNVIDVIKDGEKTEMVKFKDMLSIGEIRSVAKYVLRFGNN